MRLGILIATAIAILLNVVVVALLFQAACVPAGVGPARTEISPAPSVRRHGIIMPTAPMPQSRPAPEPTVPSSRMVLVPLVLGVAGLAAGGSLLALGVLAVLILRSGRKTTSSQASWDTGAASVPSADSNPMPLRFDPGLPSPVPTPRRDLPSAPTLVIPESLTVHPEPAIAVRMGAPGQEDDPAWIGLARECVDLFDEMDRAADGFVPADHVRSRLLELLERSGVEVIENDKVFLRTRHQAKNATRMIPDGAPIRLVVSPGFAVGPQVLRRASVQIAD